MPTEMYLSIIRHLLTLAGGILATKGYISGGMVETIASSVIAVGATAWGAIQKIEQAREIAKLTPSTAAKPRAASEVAMPATAPIIKAVIALLALAFGYTLAVAPARAEGIQWKGKPYTPPAAESPLVGFSSPVLYMSFIGVHSRVGSTELNDDEEKFVQDFSGSIDNQWRLGLGFGYLVRNEKWAAGFDFDATRRVSGGEAFDNEWDNWNFSARARGGYFITANLMPYITAGYAHAWTQDTLVYGLGLETFLTDRTSIRFEVLKYEVNNDWLDLRVSYNLKF